MKRILAIPMLLLFVSVHGTGLGDFNIFRQRKIVVGPLENRGPERYDYLQESLRDQVAQLIADAPFIALTDQERAFLLTLSMNDDYKSAFAETGGSIVYRLDPLVVKDMSETGERTSNGFTDEAAADAKGEEGEPAEYPLYLTGSYEVVASEQAASRQAAEQDTLQKRDDPQLHLSLVVRNRMTGRTRDPIDLQGPLSGYIDDPGQFLFPLLPDFLRYTIYRATFTAEPSEASILIDDRLLGIGSARNVLVTPGLHRITVRSDGYREYRDLIQINQEDFSRHIVLEEEPLLIRYLITSTPDGAQVYLDAVYQGDTPVSISVGPSNRTLTLSKPGYRSESLALSALPPAGGKVAFSLIESGVSEELKSKAEKYRSRGKVSSWIGLGVLATSILFGTLSVSKQQEADLYETTDPERAADAQSASDTLNTLLISSLVLAGGIFTFSFIQTVQYFKLYNRAAEYDQIPIISTEYSF
jgi:hypothetical protein